MATEPNPNVTLFLVRNPNATDDSGNAQFLSLDSAPDATVWVPAESDKVAVFAKPSLALLGGSMPEGGEWYAEGSEDMEERKPLGEWLAAESRIPHTITALRYVKYYGSGGGILAASKREEVREALNARGSLVFSDYEEANGLGNRFAPSSEGFRGADLLELANTSGSDYGDGGATVALANVASLKGELDSIAKNHGMEPDSLYLEVSWIHNSFGLVIRTDAYVDRYTVDFILETARGLENYPVIDEDKLSEIELEREDEGWESSGASDYEKAIVKRIAEWCELVKDELELEATPEALAEAWQRADNGSGLVTHEDSGPYFDIEKATKQTEVSALFASGVRLKIEWPAIVADILRADAAVSGKARNDAATLLRLGGIEKALRAMLRTFGKSDSSVWQGAPDGHTFELLRPEWLQDTNASGANWPILGAVGAEDWEQAKPCAILASVRLRRYAYNPTGPCETRDIVVTIDAKAGELKEGQESEILAFLRKR